MARVRARMHPGRVLREEYMEPMQLSANELQDRLAQLRLRVGNRR